MAASSAALAFGRRLLQAAADEVEELPFGLALRTPSLAGVHNLNRLQVVGAHPGLTVTDLAAQLDARVGAPFKDVLVEDDQTAARLEPAFKAAGYEVGRELCMVLTGAADRPPEPGAAEEVDSAVLRDERFWTDLPDPEKVRQLLERDRRMAEAVDERGFAVLGDDGRPLAGAKLRVHEGVAQVEDVIVLPEHRGKGHGRAVAAAATQAARDGGHDVVFLFADADGWPRDLYAKLGFEGQAGMIEALTR
jgi:ribosomal protein S18 acetylase RimI-like enzyme